MFNLYYNGNNKPLKAHCLHKEVKNLLCVGHKHLCFEFADNPAGETRKIT